MTSDNNQLHPLAFLVNLPSAERKRMVLGDDADIGFQAILTYRERVIVNLLAEGITQRTIAATVFRVDEALISRELKVIRRKIVLWQNETRQLPIQLTVAG